MAAAVKHRFAPTQCAPQRRALRAKRQGNPSRSSKINTDALKIGMSGRVASGTVSDTASLVRRFTMDEAESLSRLTRPRAIPAEARLATQDRPRWSH